VTDPSAVSVAEEPGAPTSAAVATAPSVADPERRRRRWAVAGVGLWAFLLRLPALGRPRSLVFDEAFYAPDAADLIRWGSERGKPAHPQLGKWLIAGGIRLFGFTPFGWRIASVVAGALVCATVTWIAVLLTRRVRAGVVAGLLVSLDGIVHVTSRLALLDVFVALFTTASLAALVRAWLAQPDRAAARRWWWLASVAMALGAAVKWSSLALLPVLAVVGWVLARRLEPPGRPRRAAQALRLGSLLVLPVVAILAFAAPRELGPDRISPQGWWNEQVATFRFHKNLRPTNPNAANAWTWATLSHPANLYRLDCPVVRDRRSIQHPKAPPVVGRDTTSGACRTGAFVVRVIAGGNPVVWVVGVGAIVGAVVLALRRDHVAGILVGGVAATWLPFVASPRVSYSFYAVTVVPPMVLCLTWVLHRLPERWERRLGTGLTLATALAFAILWPVWTGRPLSPRVHGWLTSWPGWG
jgi:predicted membrane-bound dolichyl-phosphate-mannose-protein mannosyltransferase